MSAGARRGSTLIEVLFGLVILATLLAAVVTARGRFLRQAADAEKKARLIHALDVQLERWYAAEPPTVPLNDTGALDALPGGTWRTQAHRSRESVALNALTVHVEATDNHVSPAHVTVDLLLHQADPPTLP